MPSSRRRKPGQGTAWPAPVSCSRSPSPPTTSAARAPPQHPGSHRRRAGQDDRAGPRRVSEGTYGSPRVHAELVPPGHRLRPAPGGPAHAPGRPGGPVQEALAHDHRRRARRAEAALDLIQRHFGPCAEMDTRYVGDITYIWTWEGWAYLATVIDLASRRVVGWALADHMRTELVEDALRWPSPSAGHRGASSSIPTVAVSTPARTSPTLAQGERRRAVGRAQGRMLGQRRGRIVFRHHQARAHRPPGPGAASTELRRAVFELHRGLVQHPPAATARCRTSARPSGKPPTATSRLTVPSCNVCVTASCPVCGGPLPAGSEPGAGARTPVAKRPGAVAATAAVVTPTASRSTQEAVHCVRVPRLWPPVSRPTALRMRPFHEPCRDRGPLPVLRRAGHRRRASRYLTEWTQQTCPLKKAGQLTRTLPVPRRLIEPDPRDSA